MKSGSDWLRSNKNLVLAFILLLSSINDCVVETIYLSKITLEVEAIGKTVYYTSGENITTCKCVSMEFKVILQVGFYR